MSRSGFNYETTALIVAGVLIISALTSVTAVKVIESSTKKGFGQSLKASLDEVNRLYGIPPDIALMQAAHESNWGQSQLSREAYNLFGLTTPSAYNRALRGSVSMSNVATWTVLETGHAVISLPTKEYDPRPPASISYFVRPGDIISKKDDGKGGSILMVERDFKRYASPLESLKDWARLISTLYPTAYAAARADDAQGFANALVQGPNGEPQYATDPNYATSMLANLPAVKSDLGIA